MSLANQLTANRLLAAADVADENLVNVHVIDSVRVLADRVLTGKFDVSTASDWVFDHATAASENMNLALKFERRKDRAACAQHLDRAVLFESVAEIMERHSRMLDIKDGNVDLIWEAT